ncbi:hypothetical protein MNBD_ALPHA11-944 [hydrothermal vent metagenome]|uniref:Uncharacterized protein n=1 Tax=hydrothermal vent metagenome TaxID=652676 RepID=A0A3B0TQK5_9ZZZZ
MLNTRANLALTKVFNLYAKLCQTEIVQIGSARSKPIGFLIC